jgi:WD40 repeat protein
MNRALALGLAAIVWQSAQPGAGPSVIQLTHELGEIASVYYATYDGFVIIGADDGTLLVWDKTKKLRKTAKQDLGTPCAILTDVRSKTLIVGRANGVMTICSIEDLSAKITKECHDDGILCAALIPHKNALLIAGGGRKLRILNSSDLTPIGTFESDIRLIWSLAITEDGKEVFVAGDDKTIEIWHLETRKQIGKLEGHTNSVNELLLARDGRKLISAGIDGEICVWDVETKKRDYTFRDEKMPVCKLCLLEENRIGVGTIYGTIEIWDYVEKKLYTSIPKVVPVLHCMASSPDGREIIVGSNRKGVLKLLSGFGIERKE